MGDQIWDFQGVTTGEFLDEQVDAGVPEAVIGGGQINQVAVVADGLAGI